MSILKKIIKRVVKQIWGQQTLGQIFWKQKGISLLTLEGTRQTLELYCIKTIPQSFVDLPDITDEDDPSRLIYQSNRFASEEVYVWKHELEDGFVSKYGSIVMDKEVLCTDWDHRGFEHDFWKKDNRAVKHVKTIIPLLSHHQDTASSSALTGYYDFVLMVAAKLSRIKDTLKDEDLQGIVITYPPFGGSYERQYIELLGFNPDNYIDCRNYKLSAETALFGNCGTWKPNVNEIKSLKRNIESRLNISETTPTLNNRIYISRKGRREIENESELIELLKKFNFIVIEDKERSVKEQIEIYRNASFIIGPHGASFANVIWCRPQTHLYELFAKSWAPDYFLYLAKINDMYYSAYQDDTHEEITNDFFAALSQNVYVSIRKLKASLEKILNEH